MLLLCMYMFLHCTYIWKYRPVNDFCVTYIITLLTTPVPLQPNYTTKPASNQPYLTT